MPITAETWLAGVLAELREALEPAAAAGIAARRDRDRPRVRLLQDRRAESAAASISWRRCRRSAGRCWWGRRAKRFLGSATGVPVEDRDRATATACALAYERGARLFRVHDVAGAREALALAQAVGGGWRDRFRASLPATLPCRRWPCAALVLGGLRPHPGADRHLLGCRRVHRGGQDARHSPSARALRSSS